MSEPIADEWGTYSKMRCPHCEAMNWVYLGRMEDITAPDREGMECWSCGKRSWLHWSTKSDMGYDSIDEAYVEKGTKEP